MAVREEKSFLCLSGTQWHRVAYGEWRTSQCEDRPSRVAVCVHGLTRNGHDFSYLAKHLCEARQYPVYCIDIPGRGNSEWLSDKKLYEYPTYTKCVATFFAHIGAEEIDYIGTSMGGLIGMMLSNCTGCPIRRLVLNDISPFVPKEGVARLIEYVGKEPPQPSLEAFATYLSGIMSGYGNLTEEEWLSLAHTTCREVNGEYRPKYDPDINIAFSSLEPKDLDMFPLIWPAIKTPVMLIRGEDTDLVPMHAVEKMKDSSSGPGLAEFLEVKDTGHAPSLMRRDQIDPIIAFLES